MARRMNRLLQGRYIVRLLIYFYIIGFLPLCLFYVISNAGSTRTAGQYLGQLTVTATDSIANDLDVCLSEYEAMLKSLSTDGAILNFVECGFEMDETTLEPSARTERAIHHLYAAVRRRNRELAAHVVSRSIDAGISTSKLPVNYLVPYNRNWGIFRMADESEGAVFRTYDNNPNALARVCFSLARAVRSRTGHVEGYVVFDIYRNVLDEMIERHEQAYRMDTRMGDRFNFAFYNSAGEARGMIPAYLRGVEGGEAVAYAPAGEPGRYLYAAGIDRFGVKIYGEMPLSYAEATGRYVRRAVLVAAVICFALCTLFALLAWYDLSTPLQRLTAAIGEMERGNLGARVNMKARNDEMGKLGENFNHMAAEIEQLLRNVEEKQQRLRIAESSALQAQINPHFLYNTLDLIKWSAKLGQTDEVARIVVLLGKLLRAMANFDQDIVTVAEEMELIHLYLDIQRIHYAGRLTVQEQVPPEVEPLRIPKLMLQPVVENAFEHGFRRCSDCALSIRADYEAPYLRFEIEDNGAGIPEETIRGLFSDGEAGGSIGLRNVHRRAQLYGDERCGLEIHSRVGEGTRVTIRLKCRAGITQGGQEPDD